MKLLTYRTGSTSSVGVLDGEFIVPLPFKDLSELLREPDWRERVAAATGDAIPLPEVSLAPVVQWPRKILCVGHNYVSHIAEMGREQPQYPTLFAKFDQALIGANDDLILPAVSERMDWEAELALVIGHRARHVRGRAAIEAVAGYTVMNDVSARDYQWRTTQWLQGKTFDHTTPLGPVLVGGADLDDAGDLPIRCEIDGQVMQQARTSDLLFGPTELVEYLSDIVTLEPGDVIATGTPGGVGIGRDPQVFLSPGQTVVTTVEGIGELRNRCVRERQHTGTPEAYVLG